MKLDTQGRTENAGVASSILALGTRKCPIYGHFFITSVFHNVRSLAGVGNSWAQLFST